MIVTYMYMRTCTRIHIHGFGTANCILFIEMSSFQSVLRKGFHCIHIIWLCICVLYVCSKYTCTCIATQ